MGNLAWNVVKAGSSLGVEMPASHGDQLLTSPHPPLYFFSSSNEGSVRPAHPSPARCPTPVVTVKMGRRHPARWSWVMGIFALKTKATQSLKGLPSPPLGIPGLCLFPSPMLYSESLKREMAQFHFLKEGMGVTCPGWVGFQGLERTDGEEVSRLHWGSSDKRNKKWLHGSPLCFFFFFFLTHRHDFFRKGEKSGKDEQ